MISHTPDPAFIDRIRDRLGDRYDIEREILGGGMSRVFVAREKSLDRQVVIKFLPPEIAAEANRDRFRREIQMAARLSHPHIAPLFSAAEDGELLYYTMPFITGESLKHQLELGRRFSVEETLEILHDVADALAYAHKSGIVHRDIKPGNVLREGHHAVITDFGVAKAVSFALGLDSRSSVATTTGMAIGTPAYMAPEQIAGDASADHRVDIYAFGLLGYELLTGHAPFRAPSPQAQLAAQLTQTPAPIHTVRSDVPPVLAVLLARCLEKDAARRPPSAEAVLEVLRAVGSSSGAMYTTWSPRTKRSKALLAAAAVAVIAAGVWAVTSKRETSPPTATVARVDTVLQKPSVPTPLPSSAVTKAERDSIRLISEQLAKKDARLLGLVKDSVANAVRRSMTDSITKEKEAELAATRVRDSVARGSRVVVHIPAFSMGSRTLPLLPEMFTDRAQHMGPPRRIGIAIYSGLRNPSAVIAAGVIRDSMLARLRTKDRFVVIPQDSIANALARSRTIDSLRTWLKADLWVTINSTGEFAADSMQWSVTMRDFTSHTSYSQRGIVSKRVSANDAAPASIISMLTESTMRELDAMDRAPRRVLLNGRSAGPEARPE